MTKNITQSQTPTKANAPITAPNSPTTAVRSTGIVSGRYSMCLLLIRLYPSAGVSLLVDVLHAGGGHVRVDLRGREVGVAEEFLDDTQVRAVVEQVRGEGMTQCVGSDLVRGGDGQAVLVEHPPQAPVGQAAAEAVEEQGVRRRASRRPAARAAEAW
jgi:hypothetical protein